jgi:hypothetical protein
LLNCNYVSNGLFFWQRLVGMCVTRR